MIDFNQIGGVLLWQIKYNRKIALLWIGAILFLLAEVAIYFPFYLAEKGVSARIAVSNSQMEMARSAGLTQISAPELAKLRSRLSYFKGGFVTTAQIPAILNRISDQAEKNNVRVININSGSPVPMSESAPEDSGGVPVSGQKFTRLPIHLLLEGQFKSFAEFLNSLNKSSQQVFVVESYTIKKPKESAVLNCDMILSFFTAGQPTGA